MANQTILLIGRGSIVVADAASKIDDPDVTILTGSTIDDVRKNFSDKETKVDHVFMGAGIELQKCLDIVAEIFNSSSATTVHLKDASSGPKGFLPFVRAVLKGMKGMEGM